MDEAEARAAVREILGEDKAELWWGIKNPNFGDLSPAYLVNIGRTKHLFNFIEYALENERLVREMKK